MGVMDVVEGKTGNATTPTDDSAEPDTNQSGLGGGRPSLSISTANGTFVLDAVTLALYGVVLADALLIYIAWRL